MKIPASVVAPKRIAHGSLNTRKSQTPHPYKPKGSSPTPPTHNGSCPDDILGPCYTTNQIPPMDSLRHPPGSYPFATISSLTFDGSFHVINGSAFGTPGTSGALENYLNSNGSAVISATDFANNLARSNKKCSDIFKK